MEIAVCGVNHHLAPVAVLERLAFSVEARRHALAELTRPDAPDQALAAEAVIVSTCNRVEIYAAATGEISGHGAAGRGDLAQELGRYLAAAHGLDPAELAPYLYTYCGEDAVRHLLRVAGGLDSLVIGEPQILGQVRSAFKDAAAVGAAGAAMSALFRHALQAGKRARTETGISAGAASVSSAAVAVAERESGALDTRRVLIVGAGKTGSLAAQCLLGRGARQITVANRTLQAAEDLAQTWGGAAYELTTLDELLPLADIVISATRAPGYVLTAEQVRRAQAQRDGRPLLLIDIAMPRDIEPAAGTVPGVTLRNIDDLHAVVATNLDHRRGDSGQAEAIIEAEVAEFVAWLKALAVVPVISDLREQADAIRRRELERARHRLAPDDVDLVDMLTQRIVNQLLHQPTVRLKEHAGQADGELYAGAVRDLFGLDDEDEATS